MKDENELPEQIPEEIKKEASRLHDLKCKELECGMFDHASITMMQEATMAKCPLGPSQALKVLRVIVDDIENMMRLAKEYKEGTLGKKETVPEDGKEFSDMMLDMYKNEQ